MKYVYIPGGALAISLLVSMTGAQAATECQADIIKGRTSHWTYRLIDGRKCWYEGKTQLPKSELYWTDRKAPDAREAVQTPQAPQTAKPAQAAPMQAINAPQAVKPPQARNVPVSTEDPRATNAQASPSQTESERGHFSDPEDGSCCWPPQQADSFESRWRSLGLRSAN